MKRLVTISFGVSGETNQDLINEVKKLAGISIDGLLYDIHSSEDDYNSLDYEPVLDADTTNTENELRENYVWGVV